MTADRHGYVDYWVWTMQIAKWRLARDLRFSMMDITAKSGIKTFAPEWENLRAYQRGEMHHTEYSYRYYQKVLQTTSSHEEDWQKLEADKNLVLACYCRPGEYCHRHLFATLAVTYLQSRGHRVLFMGELVEHPNHSDFYSSTEFYSQDPYEQQTDRAED